MCQMKKKLTAIILSVLGAAAAAAVAGAALLFFGVIHFNHPELTGKTVRGVDVSAYQGEIDWDILASQGIDFAYIKATEGSGYVDPQFAANWEHAASTGLRIGAYHFFSFETPGATQAENFCNTVTASDGMLPPVIVYWPAT